MSAGCKENKRNSEQCKNEVGFVDLVAWNLLDWEKKLLGEIGGRNGTRLELLCWRLRRLMQFCALKRRLALLLSDEFHQRDIVLGIVVVVGHGWFGELFFMKHKKNPGSQKKSLRESDAQKKLDFSPRA